MKKMFKIFKGKIKKIKYTQKHRKAFRLVEERLIEKKVLPKNSKIWLFHDLEKPLLYLIFGINLGSTIHRTFSRHHLHSIRKNKKLIEIVIDMECARYTKPDKPLNAYETIFFHYPEYTALLIPIVEKLGLVPKKYK